MKMNKKIMLSGLLIAALSISGAAVFANNSKKAEYHEYLEQQTEAHLALAYHDAVESFHFNENGYKLFRADSLDRPADMDKDDYNFLQLKMGETIFETGEIESGDFAPAIYIHDSLDDAVVFVKQQNGVSKMFVYEKDDSEELRWKLIEKKQAYGKKISTPESKTFEEYVLEKE